MATFADTYPVEVRRYAIKYSPPTIVIEYKKDGKLYIKKIRLKITEKSDANRIVKKLIRQNSDLLDSSKICKDQLTELVTLLIDVTTAAGAAPPSVDIDTSDVAPSDNSNGEPPPGPSSGRPPVDPARTLVSRSSSDGAGSATGLDTDVLDDVEFNSLIMSLSPTHFDGVDSRSKTAVYTPDQQAQRAAAAHPIKVDSRGRVLDEDRLLSDISSTDRADNSSYAVVDLNKAPQVVVDKVKEHMSLQFSTNQLKPGDEGYVYDLQKDFSVPDDELEPNDWDDDDE